MPRNLLANFQIQVTGAIDLSQDSEELIGKLESDLQDTIDMWIKSNKDSGMNVNMESN